MYSRLILKKWHEKEQELDLTKFKLVFNLLSGKKNFGGVLN